MHPDKVRVLYYISFIIDSYSTFSIPISRPKAKTHTIVSRAQSKMALLSRWFPVTWFESAVQRLTCIRCLPPLKSRDKTRRLSLVQRLPCPSQRVSCICTHHSYSSARSKSPAPHFQCPTDCPSELQEALYARVGRCGLFSIYFNLSMQIHCRALLYRRSFESCPILVRWLCT